MGAETAAAPVEVPLCECCLRNPAEMLFCFMAPPGYTFIGGGLIFTADICLACYGAAPSDPAIIARVVETRRARSTNSSV